MKKFIVTKKQLNEYINKKRSEKIFNEILEKIFINQKNLNENFSIKKVNQTIIDSYKNLGLIDLNVEKLLVENQIINQNGEII